MINIETDFYNANEAFEYFYKTISEHGEDFADTKALFNRISTFQAEVPFLISGAVAISTP